jgi:hypothetical protein
MVFRLQSWLVCPTPPFLPPGINLKGLRESMPAKRMSSGSQKKSDQLGLFGCSPDFENTITQTTA